MNRKYIFAVIALYFFFSLNACGLRRPSPEDLRTADYGVYPYNYEEIINNHLDEILFDPYSVKGLRITSPETGWYNSFGKISYGYRGKVSFNAKNRYGGYVGKRTYWYFIRNNKLLDFVDARAVNWE